MVRLSLSVALALAELVFSSTLPPLGYERAVLRNLFDKRGISSNGPGKGKGPKNGKGHGPPGLQGFSSCLDGEAPTTTAPRSNVWAPLTPEENTAVWNLLHEPSLGMNLTHPSDAVLTDNYVFWIDVLPQNKTSVLPYLDGEAPAPPKYARAIIFEGGKADPDSQEYMIGPLPVSEETKVEKLDYIYNGGRGGSVPFNARYFDGPRSRATDGLITQVMSNISDITSALFSGGVYFGSGDPRTNMQANSGTPQSWDGSTCFRNIQFKFPGPASYLTPLDFYLMIDCTGTDPSHYKLNGIVTNSKFFPTVEEFRRAYESGELAQEFAQTVTSEANWALLDYKPELGVRDLEERLAPSSIELGGKRYRLDKENQYVEYMGWSFYWSFTRTLGIQLYDVKYKGERILYELSMQEAMAQYGGNQPKAANTVYQDTYYSMGADMSTLVEGFDCPWGSTFLNISFGTNNITETNRHAFCIFEADMGFPVSRHRTGAGNDYTFSNLASVKGTQLTLRTIATIGNYDYMFDYSFKNDGSLESVVRASGYLQSSAYYPDQGKWGPRVHQGTQGSLHDHVITFKADFDIIDTKNSLQVSELQAVNVTQPWYPELGSFEQMEMNIYNMEKEQQFNWAPNNQAMYVVTNPNKLNKWGSPRGYRMVPGRSNIHLTTLKSPWSAKNSEFTKSHLAVTRQHDNEPFAGSCQNANLPAAPQQDFSKFFDGESVDNEDIVLWYNLGMHHFTRSEDVPVTLNSEAYSSIVFAPQNFFDRAEDGDLLNRVWMEVDKEGKLSVESYGVELETCAVQIEKPGEHLII